MHTETVHSEMVKLLLLIENLFSSSVMNDYIEAE